MKRKIVKIDENKCNGCGLCIEACHEGALRLVNGKAKLISDSYCDGLGDCLPACPKNAITIEERDAEAFDEASVEKNIYKNLEIMEAPCTCPGSTAKKITIKTGITENENALQNEEILVSGLSQWPCQLKLVPINAEFFKNADLLIAADCTAFAYPDIHRRFMNNKVTLIGCPKLDNIDYSDKMAEIITKNDIKSITVLRMEVPCCGGIVNFVKEALKKSGKIIPWSVKIIGIEGDIKEEI